MKKHLSFFLAFLLFTAITSSAGTKKQELKQVKPKIESAWLDCFTVNFPECGISTTLCIYVPGDGPATPQQRLNAILATKKELCPEEPVNPGN